MGVIKSVGKGLGKAVKPFVNFPQWMGIKELTATGKVITALSKDILNAQNPNSKRQETFEQAVKRLGMSEKDIKQRQKSFLLFALFYFAIALVLAFYAIYLFANIKILAGSMSILLAFIGLVFAYREHFWYFQMKHHKLGYNFKDWLKGIFGSIK